MVKLFAMNVCDKCTYKWAKEAATHGGSEDIFFNIIHLLD
jgi:hypothetical protein